MWPAKNIKITPLWEKSFDLFLRASRSREFDSIQGHKTVAQINKNSIFIQAGIFTNPKLRDNKNNMVSTANTILLLSLACLLGFSVAQVDDQVRVENYPLSLASPVNCEEIVETHTFKGTCCALNTTVGDGCVLNVVNGQCVVRNVSQLIVTSTVMTICSRGARS